MENKYNADYILAKLQDLHPKFYPVPFLDIDGTFVNQNIDHLTQSKLSNLYHTSAKYLHRGNINDLREPKILDFESICTAREQIVSLLNRHKMLDPNEEWMFVVQMEARPAGSSPDTPAGVDVSYWEVQSK